MSNEKNIRLVNRESDGKLIGLDENNNVVPVEIAEANLESVSTDRTDTESFDSGFGVTSIPYNVIETAGYNSNVPLNIASMNWYEQEKVRCHPVFTASSMIYRGSWDGSISQEADGAASVTFAAPVKTGEWLVFFGTDASVYGSASDINSDTANGSQTGIHAPLIGSIVGQKDPNESNRSWVFGEYRTDGNDPRIWKVYHNGTFVSTTFTECRHFHSCDADPYNDGRHILTAGDPGDEVRWVETTDYGNNFSTISTTVGDQTYRTLRVHMTENAYYWGMDQTPATFYKADRGDLANPTPLFEPGDIPGISEPDKEELRCFGSCYVNSPREGIVYTVRHSEKAKTGNEFDRIPVYFYDLQTETMRVLTWLETDYSLDNKPGVHATLPYADDQTGHVWMQLKGVANPRGLDTFTRAIKVPELMGD